MNRNGLLLALATIIVGAVWQVAIYSAIITYIERSGAPATDVALPSADVPLSVSVGGIVLSYLLLQYLTIVAMRTFVGGHSRSIPSEYYTRNIVFVVVNSLLAGLAFGLLVLIGSILLIIPGIIAYIAFIFVFLYVAVDDENVITALSESWSLTRGSWIRLFVLLFIVFVGIGVLSSLFTVISAAIIGAVSGPVVSTLVSGVITLPFSLLTLGILADAFTQLREGRADAVDG